jgi:DIM1 family U5 snRNP protein
MSYLLPHLNSGWAVDQAPSASRSCASRHLALQLRVVSQAILGEESRVVVIRFGHDWDPACMKMDEVLHASLVHRIVRSSHRSPS